MKSKITIVGLALLSILSCKILKPSADKFITYKHQSRQMNVLIHRVDKASWKIGYRYGSECKSEDRQNDKALQEEITTILRTWLKPLRDMKPARPIIDVFHFQLQEDFKGDEFENLAGKLAVDVRVTFQCVQSFSYVLRSATPPDVFIRQGTKINRDLLFTLTHELGHAFGLSDTYLNAYSQNGIVSSGGIDNTAGTQPSSVMSIVGSGETPTSITEDDKRAIIWLYKAFHEGLDTKDCFFPDYVYEQEPPGCRPKYPLIFEAKYSLPIFAIKLLDEDSTIDVNAQDAGEFTALHYAAMYEKTEVVKRLLEHKDINPSLRDKQGRTALDIAREANLTEIIALLQAVTPPQRTEDINGDGVVNILDLVVAAHNFGKQGNNKADVDGNGIVNILDLVQVASAFGDAEANAPLHPEVAKALPATKLSQWLRAARQQASAKPAHRRGIQVLEQLLARATPSQTRLLANYPNPFNPETWLPYQLAKPERVKMLIHATDGKLVRILELGNLPAGVYQSKSRAAHWDGRNAQGELAASGVYFYTLSAGDVTATRKMLLRK